MDTPTQTANQTPLPDPTKPVIPPKHLHISKSWIIFIALNITIPVVFAVIYLFIQKN